MKRSGILSLAVFVLVAAGLAIRTFFPIELAELDTRWKLRRLGVKEGVVAGLATLELNHCEKEGAPRDNDGKYVPGTCHCVLLIHGAGDSSLTWKRLFELPTPHVSAPLRMVAIDLPGSGRTPDEPQAEDLQVRRLARRISQALPQIPECRQWTLVGNSFGGWVAAWMMIDAPKEPRPGGAYLDRLLLLGSAGLKDPEHLGRKLLEKGGTEGLKEFQARAYHSPRPLSDSDLRAAVSRLARSNVARLLGAQKPEEELDTFLPQIHRPTLLLWGASDRIIPPSRGKIFGQLIRGSHFREAPACGHLPQKECPKAVAQSLEELLFVGTM